VVAACLIVASPGAPGARIEKSPFIIEYQDDAETLAEETLAILEKARAEFQRWLPTGNEPIRVIVCSTMGAFQAAAERMGRLPVEGIARSEGGVIVVKAPALRSDPFDYSGTLRHELVHVLLARNTDTAVMPRWLDEGIAMTVGKDFRWESMLHVANMYVRGRIIEYHALDFAFVAPEDDSQFGDAYAQSLSMTRFLMGRIGEEAFWEMVYSLKTRTFPEALRAVAGLTPRTLYDGWVQSLWKVALISSLVSGFSAFQVAAVLVIVAYFRKRRRGQHILRRWAAEEADDGLIMFPRELEDQEGPYPWENDDEESW